MTVLADRPVRGGKPLVVIDVAGMTPALLRYMPNLAALGWQAELGTVLLCSDPVVPRSVERAGRIAATDVRDLLLELQGIPTKELSR